MSTLRTPRTVSPASSLWRLGLVAAAITSLSACGSLVRNEPLSAAAIETATQQDKARLPAQVEPISGPLTLEEAMARALKYNLERRVKLMEEALALQQLDVTQLDMLPRLVAQAGYHWRDTDRVTLSNGETPSPVTQERIRSTGDLTFSWNLLDLGLGYYSSQQQANRVVIAMEKRRKAMHVLMQDVRTAYWRAASAHKLKADVTATIAMAEDALQDASRTEAERLRNPLDAMRYQRQLMENLRLLEAINQELGSAQIELAALINAPIGKPIEIATADMPADDGGLSAISVERMEEEALLKNADLREAHYNVQVAREEARKTLTRLLPNISFNYGIKYDSDKYLLHSDWREGGLQMSFNIFNALTGPTQMKLADAGISLAEQRRLASHAAVVAQVHLARQMFFNAQSQFKRADAIYTMDQRIASFVKTRAQAQAQSKLDMVANETASILSLLRRYQALAQVQAAQSRLQASLGLEPEIDSVTGTELKALTQQLKAASDPWAPLRKPRPVPSLVKISAASHPALQK